MENWLIEAQESTMGKRSSIQRAIASQPGALTLSGIETRS
jgi:hypothetical protein